MWLPELLVNSFLIPTGSGITGSEIQMYLLFKIAALFNTSLCHHYTQILD